MSKAINYKKTPATEYTPAFQRYIGIWVRRALRSGPKDLNQLVNSEGLTNQPYVFFGQALRKLIADCVVVDDHKMYRLSNDSDVNPSCK